MTTRRVPAQVWLEANDVTKDMFMVVDTLATAGEGDVEIGRFDLSDGISGLLPADIERRRKLRAAFGETILTPPEPSKSWGSEVVFESKGLTDATDDLHDLVEECLGRGNPATTTRRARFPIKLGPGYHTISGDSTHSALSFMSMIGGYVTGSGMYNTIISIDSNGDVLPAGVDLNGMSRSKVGNFTIAGQTYGVDAVDKALWLRKGTVGADAVSRSTNYNVLANISIEGVKYKEGVRLGAEGANNQVDTTKMYNLVGKGQFDTHNPDPVFSQGGLVVGHNVFANNLNHLAYGCSFGDNRYNIDMKRSQLSWVGGEFGGAESDIFIRGVTSYLHVSGARSEGSQRLLDGNGLSAFSQVTLDHVNWHCNNLHPDGRYMRYFSGGSLALKHVSATHMNVDTDRPRIHLRPERPLTVTVEGHAQLSPITTWFDIDQTFAKVELRGGALTECNFSGQPTRTVRELWSINGVPCEVIADVNGHLVAIPIV